MPKPRKADNSKGGVEQVRSSPIDEDLPFQRRQWLVERVAWSAMPVILLLAMLGVFGGDGPLARASTGPVDGGRVEYARFARYLAPASLDIEIASSAQCQVNVRIGDDYLKAMNVRAITPPPVSTTLGDHHRTFVFDRSTSGAATIRFELEPTRLGLQRGWVAIDGGSPVSFSHFVYP